MPADPPATPLSESDLDYGPTLRGLREGLQVFGRYTLVRMLGRGGMGVVWLAWDDKLELDVALKFLPENLVGDEAALADLRHETRRCMKLHHTNIVHVYDLVDDEATAAIAMEFVAGRPLSALRAEKATRVMDVTDVLPLLRQTCEALTYAHETAKIVHHDLKPANLMLNNDGILKVMDFGIASSLSDSMSKHSRVGQPSGSGGSGGGTLPYMSPQQIMGYPPSVVDDVYSLGATLYELLTGKPPFFRGDLARQIESIAPPSVSVRRAELQIEGAALVPAVWEQVIAACLEKDADKRPPSVAELWQRLSGGPVGQPVSQPVTTKSTAGSANTLVRHGSSKKPLLIAITAVLCLGSGAGWWFGVEAPKRAAAARMEQQRQEKETADAAEATRLAQEKADAEEKQKQMTAQAETARLAQEKADAEEKEKLMAAQLERERLQKETEKKKLAAANDFNSATIGDKRVVDLGSGVKLTLCYIPAGSFTMGSPASEADRSKDEDQVQVKISRGYWLAQAECTQAQWRAVMGTDPSQFKGDDLPVESVSWEDVEEFMAKLNGKNVLPTGWKWSLPSEAQWEYACRAGTRTASSFGDSLSSQQANFNGEYPYGSASKGPYLEKTSPVGSYAANAWGLQDMHGNVYEWCNDWYDTKLPGGTDPTGASSGSDRVFRGGSWILYGRDCRSASRNWYVPGFRYGNFGFRAASVPVER